jgi:hypothetical protein
MEPGGMVLLAEVNVARWIVSGLLCGAAVAGGVRFIIHQSAIAGGKAFRDAPQMLREAMRRRIGRRRYGAALMILVSLVFFVALNVLDPEAGVNPHVTLAVWAVVLILLVILVLVAMADVRQTLTDRTLRQAQMNEQLIEALARHVRKQREAGASPDVSDPKNPKTRPAGQAGGNGQDQ